MKSNSALSRLVCALCLLSMGVDSAFATGKKAKHATPASQASPIHSQGFSQTASLQGLTFTITSPNTGSINPMTLDVKGLKNSPFHHTQEVDGTITGAEVADLNIDGFPEIYIYVTSAGSGSYGSLVAFASNRNRSLTEIHLTPIEEIPEAQAGYMGHDEFRVVESTLVRRFAVYVPGDSNAKATGGYKQINYTLKAAEAAWQLKPERVDAY